MTQPPAIILIGLWEWEPMTSTSSLVNEDTAQREPGVLTLPRLMKTILSLTVAAWLLLAIGQAHAQPSPMLIRISEIEVHAEHLERYEAILREEAEASVRLEPGVIAIFPMHRQEDRTVLRILEIYADRQAYEAHLKTPHFQKYKTSTLHMVKSLKLVDMSALDTATMATMFAKLKGR